MYPACTTTTKLRTRPSNLARLVGGGLALVVAALATVAALAAPASASTQSRDADAGNYALASPTPAVSAPIRSQYFAATGKTAQGDFLATFQRYGLSLVGYPIEAAGSQNGRTVQYFERVRMEQSQSLAGSGQGVTLGLLGVELTQGQQFVKSQPFASTSSSVYIQQTSHSMGGLFLTYWKDNGGLALFGYPLSEAIVQDGLTVQWFERARFEYHPELTKGGRPVLLTLLGGRALDREKQAGQAGQAGHPATQPQQPISPGSASSPGSTPTAVPVQAPASTPVTLSSDEDYLLKAVNQQRAAVGAGPVQIDVTLADIARARSADMAARNYFSHTTPEGTNFFSALSDDHVSYRFAGEIIARNNYPDNQADSVAIDSYLHSPAHKSIMLDGRFQWAGVGHVKASDGMHYVTILFVQR